MAEKIGKHEAINLLNIKDSVCGICFHGEVWVHCPYCGKAHQVVGKVPLKVKDDYKIYECERCGKLFKDY